MTGGESQKGFKAVLKLIKPLRLALFSFIVVIMLFITLQSVYAAEVDFSIIDSSTLHSCSGEGYVRTCSVDGSSTSAIQVYGDGFYKNNIYIVENFSWQNISSTTDYYYGVTGAYYDFRVKEYSGSSDTVQYCLYDDCLTYTPLNVSWRNSTSIDTLDTVQNVSVATGDFVAYYNGVLNNTNLSYVVDGAFIKEKYTLISPFRDPLITGNVSLYYGGLVNFSDLDWSVGGVVQSSNFTTQQRIDILADGDLRFYFPEPLAIDDDGNGIVLTYDVRFTGSDSAELWIVASIDWINHSNRSYPVVYDPTLYVDNGVLELEGNVTNYSAVEVINGGVLQIGSSGFLNLTVDNFLVDATSSIDADAIVSTEQGSGGSGEFCDGGALTTGGGGAGHYAVGGDGSGYSGNCDASGGSGGSSYGDGSSKVSVSKGLAGGTGGQRGSGASGGEGGYGGSGLRIYAYDSITIAGDIDVSGGHGYAGNDGSASTSSGSGGGGGSAGKILLLANDLNVSGFFDASGGNGGGCGIGSDNDNVAGGGGGGSGGIITLVYGSLFTNTSFTYDVAGGDGGSTCDGGDTSTNPTSSDDGGDGYYTFLQAENDFNVKPVLETNALVPSNPTFGNTVYVNSTVSDADNDSVLGVYYSVQAPNGSLLLNAVGVQVSGDATIGVSEEWHSSSFDILNATGHVGLWTYNTTIETDSVNPNRTYASSFWVNDSTNPVLTMFSLTDDQVWSRNITIPLNFSVIDNVEVDQCWFSLEGVNTTVSCSEVFYFNVSAGVHNLTLYANDTSGNVVSLQVSDLSFTEDIIAPVLDVVAPNGSYASTSVPIKINVTEAGGVDQCTYNITRGASLEIATNQIFLSAGMYQETALVSGEALYVLNARCVDYQGLAGTATVNFSVTDTGGDAGGGGGGGSSGGGTTTIIEGDKRACNITVSPERLFMGQSGRAVELSIVNEDSITYSPDFEFRSTSSVSSSDFYVTNPVLSVLIDGSAQVGVGYDGSASGEALLILSSTSCEDIEVPLSVDLEEGVSFLDLLFGQRTSFSDVLLEPFLTLDSEYYDDFKFINFLSVYILLFFIALVLGAKGLAKNWNDRKRATALFTVLFFAVLAFIIDIFIFGLGRL